MVRFRGKSGYKKFRELEMGQPITKTNVASIFPVYECHSKNHDFVVKDKRRGRKRIIMIHVDFGGKRKSNHVYPVCEACINLSKKIRQLSIKE